MTKRRRQARVDNHGNLTPRLVQEMRGLVQATRTRSVLRSLTPTQAKVRMNELFDEVSRNVHKGAQRKVPENQVLRAQVPGRRPTSELDLPRQRVPASVRNLFQSAQRALVCSSRKTRREIMFAMRRNGKAGARRNKKARWRSDSYISCKRG